MDGGEISSFRMLPEDFIDIERAQSILFSIRNELSRINFVGDGVKVYTTKYTKKGLLIPMVNVVNVLIRSAQLLV